MTNLSGLGTALITPFTPSGEVDYEALDRLLTLQIQGGVDYLVVLGTTGEAVTLSPTERTQVRQHIVRFVAGRLPLVLGLGGNCTAYVLDSIREMHTELLSDFAAILSVCPYYNKPSQEGLFAHFSAIAEVCPIPVILYNVPGRTGINLLPETVMRLHAAYPDRIIGIKEASGNLDQIRHLCQLSTNTNTPLLVISGDDGLAIDVMQAGGAGLISVASNAWPVVFGTIVRAYASERAHIYSKEYEPMIRLLFAEGNPSGIKTVLSQMGLISNQLRLPLVPCSPTLQSQIEQLLHQL